MFFYNFKIQYILFLTIVFLIVIFLYWRRYVENKNFNNHPLSKQRNYKYLGKFFLLKFVFLFFAFLFLNIAVLRPMWGVKKIKTEFSGIDIVFSLDVSQSMKAIDLNIGNAEVDRLTMAKKMIKDFVENNPQNKYALVIFAGEAFVSTPLTQDHSAYLTFLDGVDYDDVSTQGSNLEEALIASIDRFYNNEENIKRGRAVVLISDGGEEIDLDFLGFSKLAKDMDIRVFTIGIGSKEGVAIPLGKDFFGRISYKTYQGKIVKTKLNEKPLKKIAKESDGRYFWAKKQDDLKDISDDLADLQTDVIFEENFLGKEDQYQLFLVFSFLFFIGWGFLSLDIKFDI